MDWLDKYRPKHLNEFNINENEVKKAINWIENYKKNIDGTKKVLLILGNTGVGKTLLADLLLKDYQYQKIELNSTDIRSQKKISEFLKKSLTFKNVVDMFNSGNTPIGILMDEIDTICKLSDKGGMSEFLDILKQNDKYETNKKKIKKTTKTSKTTKTIKKDDFFKIYNPIICTSNDINDKKINELKKYSEVIYLNKPHKNELINVIKNIFSYNNIEYDENIFDKIIDHSLSDIRQLIRTLEDLYFYSNNSKITLETFDGFLKVFKSKQEDIQLIDSTKMLLSEKMDIAKSQLLFDIDCLLTPLMIYHNSIDYIKNCEESPKTKLSIYKNVLDSLCIHDTIQTNIFEVQDWDELYHIASFFGASVPNQYFNRLTNKKPTNVEFTSLLNKMSQMFVNKKMLNSAKYSLEKISYDLDEIIYITEILSFYFDNFIQSNDSSITDDSNNSDTEEPKTNDDDDNDNNNNILPNKPPIFKQHTSDLIKFMNNNSIGIDDLENLLKIEKFNKVNEKKKKKFTLKIKKEISNYLIKK